MEVKEKIRVIRALPVLISDNNQEHIAYSAYSDATDILNQLKIHIYPEDKVSAELITDPADENAAGQKIIIDRAPIYTIQVDASEKIVRSWSKDVLTVIKKVGVVLGPQDLVDPPLDSVLTPGQTIVITRINVFDENETDAIPYEIKSQTSTNVPFGQSRVTQAGINGTMENTYQVVYKNGVEVSKVLIGSETLTPKQDELVTTGILIGRANFGNYAGMVTSFYKGMTGHYLIVTNLANGEQVRVEIIGSGPFNGPLMDMGTAAFEAIGGSESSGYIPNVSVQLAD